MSDTAFEMTLYSKYLGALSVMGRVVNYSSLSADQRFSVDAAFADANKILARKKAGIRYQRTTPGCYATFHHDETPASDGKAQRPEGSAERSGANP
jgi:hypothetical protein